MSDDKNRVTDKASEIARNIWLAGVGAYGKAVEDAQDRLEKAMEPPKLFKELVKAGSALEEDARQALSGTAAARQSVEERISRVRENFHMQRPARIEDLAALERKVDQLTRKVNALRRALAEQGVAVPASKGRSTAARGGRAAQKAGPKKKAVGRKSRAGADKAKGQKTSAGRGSAPGKRRG